VATEGHVDVGKPATILSTPEPTP